MPEQCDCLCHVELHTFAPRNDPLSQPSGFKSLPKRNYDKPLFATTALHGPATEKDRELVISEGKKWDVVYTRKRMLEASH